MDAGRIEIVRRLLEGGMIQFGDFTLKSGAWSPFYFDLRLLASEPDLLARAAKEVAKLLKQLEFDRVAAIPYAGIPIGTAVSLRTGKPMIYPRKEVKAYGTGKAIEGRYHRGETVVLLDDVISNGASKLEAIAPLEEAELLVHDVVVLVDRQGTGRRDLEDHGYQLHAVLTVTEIAETLHNLALLKSTQVQNVLRYLSGDTQRPNS